MSRVASAATMAGPSVILALHTRYEAAWLEYSNLEQAHTQLRNLSGDTHAHGLNIEAGMRDNFAESEAIRYALLRQVPNDWREAAVLQFHVWGIYDSDQNTAEDHAALTVALDHLFDFMCGEGDYGDMGRQFAFGEQFARDRRRLRTGMVEALS